MKFDPTYQDSALKALCDSLRGLGDIVAYSHSEYNHHNNTWKDTTTPEPGTSSIYCSGFENIGSGVVTWECMLLPNNMAFSDYGGSTVDRSNARVFIERFEDVEGVYEASGGYGTVMVAVTLSAITDEMIEEFKSLEDYPVLDEDDLSQLEMEMEQEDWDSWIRYDFTRALHKKFDQEDEDANPETCMEEVIDAITDSKLQTLFHDLCEKTGTYWESECATNGHIDLDRLVKAATIEDILNNSTSEAAQ